MSSSSTRFRRNLPLHVAIVNGLSQIVWQLIRTYKVPVDQRAKKGCAAYSIDMWQSTTLISLAHQCRRFKTFRYLLRQSADVNFADEFVAGQTLFIKVWFIQNNDHAECLVTRNERPFFCIVNRSLWHNLTAQKELIRRTILSLRLRREYSSSREQTLYLWAFNLMLTADETYKSGELKEMLAIQCEHAQMSLVIERRFILKDKAINYFDALASGKGPTGSTSRYTENSSR